MTAKCTFCNDTKQEPGIPGPCVWCEIVAQPETKSFKLLPYGAKFRYQGAQDLWVRIGHNLIAKWPCDFYGRDGQPHQSLCSFCHLEGDDSGNTLETLVEVVDAELGLTAERDASLAREAAELLRADVAVADCNEAERREAALREELEHLKVVAATAVIDGYALQQRLTVAEKLLKRSQEFVAFVHKCCRKNNEYAPLHWQEMVELDRDLSAPKPTEEGEGS